MSKITFHSRRISQPNSLKNLCVKIVATNLQIWCRHPYGEKKRTNPFDCIKSSSILEQIIKTYVLYETYGGTNQRFLCHLLTPELINVELPPAQGLLQFASVRCSKLEKLTIDGNDYDQLDWAIFRPELFLSKFGNLKVLIITDEDKVDDKFLHSLGAYCTQLRELDIDGCHKVTDCGIQGLCVSIDSMGLKAENVGRCKAIQLLKLDHFNSRVTKRGLRMAIENLPVLKNLVHHISVVEVLAEIALDHELSNLPELAMSVIRHESPFKIGDLKLALSLCPSVTELVIKKKDEFTDTDLLSLVSLRKLEILDIHFKEIVSFDNFLAPLLKIIGSTLIQLELCWCSNCNIQLLIEVCPNLKNLWLSLSENSDGMVLIRKEQASIKKLEQNGTKLPILKKLSSLTIIIDAEHLKTHNSLGLLPYGNAYGYTEYAISQESLFSLLSSPLLTKIDIRNCDTMTDDVFLSAVKVHNFKNLQRLCFSRCNSLTNRSIREIRRIKNIRPYYISIEICNCNGIDDSESDD